MDKVLKISIKNNLLPGQIHIYDSIPGTNVELEDILKNVHNPPIIAAMEQTDGQGRLKRKWQSSYGKGLWFSFYIEWGGDEKYHLMIFAIAIALREALIKLGIDEEMILLKWPNDILVKKKKIGGILLKSWLQGQKIAGFIVGIGLNVNHTLDDFEDDIKETAISLRMIDNRQRDILLSLQKVISIIDKSLEYSRKNYFNDVLENWKKNSIPLGERILIRTADEEPFYGEYSGIDDQGALIVNVNGNNKRILSGDVGV